MSCAEKGAASEGKVPAPHEEAAVNSLSVVQLREMLTELWGEKIQELTQETNKINDCLQALE